MSELPTGGHKSFRHRLPGTRNAVTHRFEIAGSEGYITVGLYEDDTPGEIFLTMSKQGSVIAGLLEAFAVQTSLALQYNVPLGVMIEKFKTFRFEPAGVTSNPDIRLCTSVIDYIFRWLELKFGGEP